MSDFSEGKSRTILGIRFFNGFAWEAVSLALRGGLVVAPSAPVLVTMVRDADTREALLQSDLALTDSGLMVLLWNLLQRDQVRRVSGLEYLQILLERPELMRPGAMFWIMPNETALNRSLDWLRREAYPISEDDFYIAPHYGGGALADEVLLEKIIARRPTQIFTAIGGGVQERLGHYLRRELPYRPSIHCIGAAIGFITGDQVYIPVWADRCRLGWLLRCLAAPHRFIPRYWKAAALIPLLIKNRERLPVA